jgi:predicted nucleic acid-binding Zn ribbon protein
MGDILTAWEAAVGPEIARNAWPARFQRDGTLVVHARDSIWAFELTQRATEIAKRLSVEGVKFVPGPVPEGVEEATPATATAVASPTREQRERAAELAAEISDRNLRKVVRKAAELSLARAADGRPF